MRADERGCALAAGSPRALLAATYALLEASGLRLVAARGRARARAAASRRAGAVPRPPPAVRAPGVGGRPRHLALHDARAAGGAAARRRRLRRLDGEDGGHRPPLHPARQRRPLDDPGAACRSWRAAGSRSRAAAMRSSSCCRGRCSPTHPEYFPVGPDGARTDFGNACAPAPGRWRRSANGRTRCARRSGSPTFTSGRSTSSAAAGAAATRCAGLSPSDQALRVATRSADGLDADVYHLAYHDTLAPPAVVRSAPARAGGVRAARALLRASRSTIPAAPRTRAIRDALARHLEVFDGRIDAFEYYGDAILFGGCAVPLARDDRRRPRRYRAWACAASPASPSAATACGPTGSTSRRSRAARPAATRRRRARLLDAPYGDGGAGDGALPGRARALMTGVVTYGDVHLPPDGADGGTRCRGARGRAGGGAGARPAAGRGGGRRRRRARASRPSAASSITRSPRWPPSAPGWPPAAPDTRPPPSARRGRHQRRRARARRRRRRRRHVGRPRPRDHRQRVRRLAPRPRLISRPATRRGRASRARRGGPAAVRRRNPCGARSRPRAATGRTSRRRRDRPGRTG